MRRTAVDTPQQNDEPLPQPSPALAAGGKRQDPALLVRANHRRLKATQKSLSRAAAGDDPSGRAEPLRRRGPALVAPSAERNDGEINERQDREHFHRIGRKHQQNERDRRTEAAPNIRAARGRCSCRKNAARGSP